MKYYEHDGQWCEVGKLRHTYHNGQPCYEVDGRGSISFFLGGVAPLSGITHQDGSWTIQYLSNVEGFEEYAQEMVGLGAWK